MMTDDDQLKMLTQNRMLHHLLFEQQAEWVEEHASMQDEFNRSGSTNETSTPNRLLNRRSSRSLTPYGTAAEQKF
jgi:hypothetical protein